MVERCKHKSDQCSHAASSACNMQHTADSRITNIAGIAKMLNDDVKPTFQCRLVALTYKVVAGNLAKHMVPTLASHVHRSSYCLTHPSCSISHHSPCWHSCTFLLCAWHHICPLRAAGTGFLTQLATCGSNTPSLHPITLRNHTAQSHSKLCTDKVLEHVRR